MLMTKKDKKHLSQKIHLELTFEEVNLVLKSLGNLPFNQVFDVIGKIHDQANAQVDKE